MRVQHYDDETIIAFLIGEDEGDPAAALRRRHLSSCPDCADVVDEYRQILEAAGEEAVWDFRELRLEEKPSAQTLATLRNFADDMTREDAEAEPRLAELLSGPRETWAARLAAHPEWRTAGMVRKLIAATDRAIDTMPPDALEITKLAVEVAESLAPERHVSDTVLKLRGQAWRERAYALFYVGSFKESLEAVERADACFSACVEATYEQARLQTVRALVYRPLERVDEALAIARTNAAMFREYGDAERFVSAQLTRAYLLQKNNDFKTALGELERIRPSFDSISADTRARVLTNIGLCHRELGDGRAARTAYAEAAEVFDSLGVPTEAARVRWSLAALLGSEGRLDDAESQFKQVLRTFEELGMASAVALVRLELAEIAITTGRVDAVERLSREAIASFEVSGIAYSQRALTALSYLHEAAQKRRATPKLVREVKQFLRRLPDQPNLLFLPPPS